MYLDVKGAKVEREARTRARKLDRQVLECHLEFFSVHVFGSLIAVPSSISSPFVFHSVKYIHVSVLLSLLFISNLTLSFPVSCFAFHFFVVASVFHFVFLLCSPQNSNFTL